MSSSCTVYFFLRVARYLPLPTLSWPSGTWIYVAASGADLFFLEQRAKPSISIREM
jgi:hypothetical protein